MLRRFLLVGSGLSADLGLSNWASLTAAAEQEFGRAVKKSSPPRNADEGEYDRLDRLAESAGEERLASFLRAQLAHEESEHISAEKKARWGKLLSGVHFDAILTTNWDTLLPKVWTDSYVRLFPQDLTEFRSDLLTGRRTILYLHGKIDRHDAPLVVTSRDVARAEYQMHALHLADIIALHRLAVIGYGFPDKPIRRILRTAAQLVSPRGRVVVLVPEWELPALKAMGGLPQLEPRCFSDYGEPFFEACAELCDEFDPKMVLDLLRGEPRGHTINLDTLASVLSKLSYRRTDMLELREEVQQAHNAPALLDLAAAYLLDAESMDASRRDQAGLAASLLVVLDSEWKPVRRTVKALEERWLTALHEPSEVGILDPLAYAVAQKGHTTGQLALLKARLLDEEWSSADVIHTSTCYGSLYERVSALERHMSEPECSRRGILRANDIGRLDAALTRIGSFTPDRRERLAGIARAQLAVLEHSGEAELAKLMAASLRELPLR